MNVAELVGRALGRPGGHVFGLVGSGNFHLTNALIRAGARFVPSSHEAGAATMADAYARVSGQVGVVTVHQGPGVTNALTGITEAAKSRTPMLVLAPEVPDPRSNFHIDLAGLAGSIGAELHRVRAAHAHQDVARAYQAAAWGLGRTVLLALPLDVQAATAPPEPAPVLDPAAPVRPADLATAGLPPLEPPDQAVRALAEALRAAERPVFIAGRGAARQPVAAAREALTDLADRCGALLAVSAAAKGLFVGDPWYLDVSGGFASPLAAELIADADLVVAWGCTLNAWTTRHGRLINPAARIAQVDWDPAAIGVSRRVDLAVPGELTVVARAVATELGRDRSLARWRTPELAARIAAGVRWRDQPYQDMSDKDALDPRTLSVALDDALPGQRTVAVDSGNFMGYPSMFLSVPDAAGFCFTQAYQSVGLGLASAIGAALARPDRLTVAALGDGGFLMSVAELATAARLSLPLVVVVYNDSAYGAEVHHFGPHGHPLDTVIFPETDLAAIGRGFGCDAITVRAVDDLAGLHRWLAGPRSRPLVVDAKVTRSGGSWWLEEAFR